MSTPTLKLLLNALRLGQPQDPQAAIFALTEHLLAQDELIEELKKRITVVQSAAQILETKASRLEAELEGWQQVFASMQANGAQANAARADHARFQAEQARAEQARAEQARAEQARAEQARAEQARAQQQRQQSYPPQQLVPHGQAQHGPQPAAYQPPRPPSQRPPAMSDGPASQPPASLGHGQRPPSVAPPPASEPPPPFQSPAATPNDAPNYNNRREGTDPVRTRMVRSTPQMTRQQRAAASRGEQDLVSDDESSSDDFKVETVVVHKKDLDKLKNQHPEAPFRLPPPGAGIGPDRGSIPGAPWARGNRVDIKVRPAIADELTMDAVHHDSRDEGDGESSDDEGETYRDAGGLPSLAAALGLSPGDPRLQSLQRGRDPNAGFDVDRRALERRTNEDDVPTSSRRKR